MSTHTPPTSQVRHVRLLDTTLRDGEQTQGVSFAAKEKLNIARALLQSLKVDRIEVASARVSDGERQAVVDINAWAAKEGYLDKVEVLGFVDHRLSVDWVVSAGGRVINLLAKTELKVARFYYKKGAYVAAVNRAQATLNDYPNSEAAETALIILIESYQALGLTQLRDDTQRVLQASFPESKFFPKPAPVAPVEKKSWFKFW